MSIALTNEIKTAAHDLGFVRVGIARAEKLGPEGEQLCQWLSKGSHGQMTYMEETAKVRIDPTCHQMLANACSIIVLVVPYSVESSHPDHEQGRIARYAHGRDYHTVLYKRVQKLARIIRHKGWNARASVDSMPVFERAWAQRAGVGFIGKNCCLIVPGIGSHVFLAAIVTDVELAYDDPMMSRCGSCTRCLDACPTRAFRAPFDLNATRCISYLTIEHKGPIEPSLRPMMRDWLLGCDACQDVCPYNAHDRHHDVARSLFASSEDRGSRDAESFLNMTLSDFEHSTRGTPLKRAGFESMARNAAIVLGNTMDKRHLPVLQSVAATHTSDVVRDAAAWAINQITTLNMEAEIFVEPTEADVRLKALPALRVRR